MNQRGLWNTQYAKVNTTHRQTPSPFAQLALSLFPKSPVIVELGCGAGADAAYFANHGCRVIATDFSEVAIAKSQQRCGSLSGLSFQNVDMSAGSLPFAADNFDAVYARLSLHYYTDAVTKQLFQDIYRILKPKGLLLFMCRSTDDGLYGQGQQLEADMFDQSGHIRHFFSDAYARSLLGGFRLEMLISKKEEQYGQRSAYVEVVARKV